MTAVHTWERVWQSLDPTTTVSLGTVASERAKRRFASARVPFAWGSGRLFSCLKVGSGGNSIVTTGMLNASQNLTSRAACSTTAPHHMSSSILQGVFSMQPAIAFPSTLLRYEWHENPCCGLVLPACMGTNLDSTACEWHACMKSYYAWQCTAWALLCR